MNDAACSRRHPLRVITTFLFAIASGATAHGTILSYGVTKAGGFQQTSEAPPVTAISYGGLASLSATSPGDADAVMLTWPGPASPATLSQNGPAYPYEYSELFGSEAELDTGFPSGDYTFLVVGGDYDGQSAGVTLGANLYPPVPFVAPGSYSDLQSWNPTEPLDVSINGFDPSPAANVADALAVIRNAAGLTAFTTPLDPSDTAFTIPAGTLGAWEDHSLFVIYGNRIHTQSAGFGGAASDVAYRRVTQLDFTTVPEPNSILCAGVAALLGLWRRR